MGLDPHLAAVASGEAVSLPPLAERGGSASGLNEAWARALHEWLAARRNEHGGRLRSAMLVLAGTDLCQHWTLAAPAGVASLKELRSIALARCCRLFGGVADDWRVVADWNLRRPMVCAALPAALVHALQVSAERAGLRVQIESSLLTAVSALEAWLPSDGWCAWPTPSRLVLMRRQGRRVDWLQTLRRESGAGPRAMLDEAMRQIHRYGLRQGEAAPASLTWLGGALDGAALTASADASLLTLKVRTVYSLPLWQCNEPGVSEARWAASLAATC